MWCKTVKVMARLDPQQDVRTEHDPSMFTALQQHLEPPWRTKLLLHRWFVCSSTGAETSLAAGCMLQYSMATSPGQTPAATLSSCGHQSDQQRFKPVDEGSIRVWCDLPFPGNRGLSLTNDCDGPVPTHVQSDVPQERVGGRRRAKGHAFLHCRSVENEKRKRSRMWKMEKITTSCSPVKNTNMTFC